MKIAIHHKKGSFSDRWIYYCDENKINWKAVDCYSNDIIQQLDDCDALMWHINQGNPKDNLFAKQLICAIEASGRKVFPNFQTSWHFDDKLGQKYLFEAIGAPLAKTWIFYDKQKAIQWTYHTKFPKVLKLRIGGGSQNVRLVKNKREAQGMIRKAFGRGFSGYYALGSLKERWRKFRLGKSNVQDLIEGVIRFFIPPTYARIRGRERGYIYFQDFIEGNIFDIRIIIIGDKAFGIKRMIRKDDFRASGSGIILYEKEHFPIETVRLSFELASKLKSQCNAFDFVYLKDKSYVLEVSFGFIKEVYDPCIGYWDKNLNWHNGKFDPCVWMVENLVKEILEA